jgi:hypothetical protein
MKKIIFLFTFTMSMSIAFAIQPNAKVTPGELCTESNPDFVGYRYKAHLAYCKRNVSQDEKIKIAQIYHIPKNEWHKYEFDHLIPLNAGGDSNITNIWPQPHLEALEKDKVELEVFNGLSNGTLTQEEAVQIIMNWIQNH